MIRRKLVIICKSLTKSTFHLTHQIQETANFFKVVLALLKLPKISVMFEEEFGRIRKIFASEPEVENPRLKNEMKQISVRFKPKTFPRSRSISVFISSFNVFNPILWHDLNRP